MAMDDRKQRIMMAIVSLYAAEGEPVGSNLLSRHFNMAVSSATLRNEMAALTQLGMLEQPHTSAGRVPTAKGYRFYVDHLLNSPALLGRAEREELESIFSSLDYDPEKMVQGAARALARITGYSVVATTPRANDIFVAHFEVIQVGRTTAAVLAVTGAGGVRTRVAKIESGLADGDAAKAAAALNKHLRFVAEADVNAGLIRTMVDSTGASGFRCWPIFSAALTLLNEAGKPNIYFEGQQHLLQWPELEPNLRSVIELFGDEIRVGELLQPHGNYITVVFGDEFPEKPIPGLCLAMHTYLAGGGLSGCIAIVGPSRMRYREVIPKLDYFCELLGRGMSGNTA